MELPSCETTLNPEHVSGIWLDIIQERIETEGTWMERKTFVFQAETRIDYQINH